MLDAEWEGILRYRERFVFTAHLPDTILPEHKELVERLAPLVRHFIVHPGPVKRAAKLAELVNSWAAEFTHCRFLAENTNPGLLNALLPHLNPDVGLCMDTGHLLLAGNDPAAWFNEHRQRVAEIHLHGLDREKAALDKRLPDHEELVERLAPLVRNFIVHPGRITTAAKLAELVNGWAAGFPRCRFLAENTSAGMLEALLPHLDEKVGLCMDTGHLLLDGKDPASWFSKHRQRVAEIHLHGLDREKAAIDKRLPDHRPVAAEAAWFKTLWPLLENFDGIINLEVFSWEEAEKSITALSLPQT
jgi:sugar phosphate isomerase/epimerase